MEIAKLVLEYVKTLIWPSIILAIVTRDEAEQIISIAGLLVDQYVAWLSWGFDDGWKPKTIN